MITHDHYLVYQFMVKNFGGKSYDCFEDFETALLKEKISKRFIPSLAWGMYNLDTQKIISQGYLCRYGFDLIKISTNHVVEYYRRLISNKNWDFISYDIQTLLPKETYKNVDDKLCKFDWDTKEQLQVNNNCSYATLPQDYKSDLKSFIHKNEIFMYAKKPYGRVIEFYYKKNY